MTIRTILSGAKDITLSNSLAFLLMLALISYFVLVMKLYQPIEVSLNGRTITEYSPIKGDVVEFVMVAKRFAANHDYDIKHYNCVNYSRDMNRIADQLGFRTKIIQGCRPKTMNSTNVTCHQWLRLEVDFEPQNAKFEDFSYKYPDQQVVD